MSFNFKIPIVILDCEMSGLDTDKHQLIQIAALKCDPRTLKVLDTFDSFIGSEFGEDTIEEFGNPQSLQNSSFYRNKERIKYSPPPPNVINCFIKWLPADYILSGYNLDLDLKFIDAVLNSSKFRSISKVPSLSYKKIDLSHLVELYSSLHGTPADIVSRRLEDVCKSFKLKTSPSHDALNDCIMGLELLKYFMDTIKFKGDRDE